MMPHSNQRPFMCVRRCLGHLAFWMAEIRLGLAAAMLAITTATAAPVAGDSPLLLYDAAGQTAFMQALTGGRLTREGRCTYLANPRGKTPLVLPSPQARWDAGKGAIRIGKREVRFGETIAIGGGEGVLQRGPLAEEARRRGCDTRRVWWGSPELVTPRAGQQAKPPPAAR